MPKIIRANKRPLGICQAVAETVNADPKKWGGLAIAEVIERERGKRIDLHFKTGEDTHEVSVFPAAGNQVMIVPKTPSGIKCAQILPELLKPHYPNRKCWVNDACRWPN